MCLSIPPPRQQGKGVNKEKVEDAWRRLVEGEQKSFVMSAMVPDDPTADYQKSVGIIEDHAYAVLKAVELRTGERLMMFRNPWGKVHSHVVLLWRAKQSHVVLCSPLCCVAGQVEWKGAWSDNSPMWTPALKRELGHTSEDGMCAAVVQGCLNACRTANA